MCKRVVEGRSKFENSLSKSCPKKKDMSASRFPSEQDFDAKKDTLVIKCSELPLGVYAIRDVTEKKGKYGQTFIGALETEAGDQYKVWLPQRLGNEVKGRELPVFVRYEGERNSSKASCGYYYAYTLL